MNSRRLGNSGLKLSELSFGSWVTYGAQLGDDSARECMAAAHDAGANFFDNAEVYAKGKSEIIMGNVLKKLGWRRESYVVSTKFFWGLNDGIPKDSRATLKGYAWLAGSVLDPVQLKQVRSLAPLAADPGCTMVQLALAWCLKNPNVSSVITGASRPSQVIENMKALDVVPNLGTDVMSKIDAIIGVAA